MRFVRFLDGQGNARWGKCHGDGLAIPMSGAPWGEHRFGAEPIAIARILAPAEPPNVFAIGLNYRGHAEEQGLKSLPDHPLVFMKATSSVIGPDEPIVLPRAAPAEVDFEAELAVIIGRPCRRVAESEAAGHILGYTCANDVSARDCQKRLDRQWTRAKSFDTFCPLGPVVVTSDALDPGDVRIRATLCGEVMQDASTRDLIFSVPRLVSYLSHQFTLLPGTVILTGTPAGVGFTRTPPRFLRPGDRIAIDIAGIGTLSNPVVADGAA